MLTINGLIEKLHKLADASPLDGDTPIGICSKECEPLPIVGMSATLTESWEGPLVMLYVEGVTVL
jgi:hypothetical protein